MSRDILAPVVVFAYNRPVHLRRTLDALSASRLAERTIVHVFADGPRKPEAVVAVAEVREVLEQEARAGRFASFHAQFSDMNLGLANSIIRGVEQVLAVYGNVIVLEDDLLVSADFLEFMNDCLVFYEHDLNIGSVAGSCPVPTVAANRERSVFAVGRSCSHGWGTWSRVWEGVDWTASCAHELDLSLSRRLAFNSEGNDRYDRLRRQLSGRSDSWSIRFGLSLFHRGLLTVYPSVNRVRNIGYDGSGVHCGVDEAQASAEFEAQYCLETVTIDTKMQRAFHKAYSGSSVASRWARNVLCWFPRLAEWLGR